MARILGRMAYGSRRSLRLAVLGVVLALAVLVAAGSAAATPLRGPYLSLGDSLAFGYQPDLVAAGDFNPAHYQSYAERFAAMRPGLQLTNLGCPGESTASFISGGCPWTVSGAPLHVPHAGSQLAAAVAFLGTRHVPDKGSAYDDPKAVWDLYVATTYDGGATWTTTQVTSDPVQRGPIADGGVAATDGRNLLDFMDAGVTSDGRVVVGFADGCLASKGCTEPGAGPATSTEAWATVAYQATGRGLFAAGDT